MVQGRRERSRPGDWTMVSRGNLPYVPRLDCGSTSRLPALSSEYPGMPYNLTIPNLKPGHYLLRHEVFVLVNTYLTC